MNKAMLEAKAALRVLILPRCLEVEPEARAKASKTLSAELVWFVEQHLEDFRAHGVAIFRSLADEIDLSYFEHELGVRKIPSQVLTQSNRLVGSPLLIVVPGVAFDRFGQRLGRGIGYYDRLLSEVRAKSPDAVAIGVGYDHQLVDRIPTEPHDAPMDMLCMPSFGLFKCTRGK